MTGSEEEVYEEVTLADLVRTVYRRKVVLLAVFMAAVVIGVAVTAFTPPEYEAKATLVPLEHQDIIKNWLASRRAAEQVLDQMGDRVLAGLFPDDWDAAAQNWSGEPPSRIQAGTALLKIVSVDTASQDSVLVRGERLVTITVRHEDPVLARDIANEYVATLATLRPTFENITRQEAFDRYYDGSNAQEANNRAEVTAKQREYWIMLDEAVAPSKPVRPNVTLNIALSVVLGLMLGVFGVFLVEWASHFRAESKPVRIPEEPSVEGGSVLDRFRYQGKGRD